MFDFGISRKAYWGTIAVAWIASAGASALGGLVGIAVLVIAAIAILIVATGKLKALQKTAWLSLLLFIPLVGLGVLVWLGVAQPRDE